jgi:sarcosine oxidase subunit alpha
VSQHFRLPAGGAVSRSEPLAFTFNGRRYQGYRGDTLASALVANGVHLVARSFKYHRPRGIAGSGSEEPNAMVRVGAGARVIPNAAATTVELYQGLRAQSINCWPSVEFDVGALANVLSALLPAGFYYKTFMWPSRAWTAYERFIRRAAGLGRAPEAPDPDRYEKRFEHCDVLVIGAGPAGIAAALAAGEAGARVVLVEENPAPGGQLLFSEERVEGLPAREWCENAIRDLRARDEVRVLTRATATGYYDHNLVCLLERVTDHLDEPPASLPRERLWKVRARQVIVATGAIERMIAFGDNDTPGVMLAGAVRRYLGQYAVRPGSRAVVFTNNDSGYDCAAALAAAGVRVAAVVDPRPAGGAAARAAGRGIRVLDGCAVIAARGGTRVASVLAAPVSADGARIIGTIEELACDAVAVSGGWDPAVHLYSQSGGRLAFDGVQQCFVPGAAAQATLAAGAANGAFDTATCIAQGREAGLAAARRCADPSAQAPAAPRRSPLAVAPFWEAPAHVRRAKKFVDLQSDVTAADLALAAREGYVAVEHAKRYTTTGMSTDQGKTGNVVAYGILARVTGRTIPEVGTTTFRPPYTPVTIGALAGRETGGALDPWRLTPVTEWHVAAGAVFEPVGLWRRPLYYPRAGEDMAAAVARECLAVREHVGILDASTLGKIDIQGPDAVVFLNRVYTNAWNDLAVGRCRYGLMLREDGMVFDDGVTSRLGESHYLMTTTSGGADGVLVWLEDWLQCEWRDLGVYLTPVTANWATVNIAGPRAREVLARLETTIDVSAAALPHMGVRTGSVMGVYARIARVSFTGELSYEVNVPARYGLALWEALMAAGAEFGITPLGTEALHVLRAEKGFIAVGHETDGTVTPLDLGMGWIVSRGKGDFLGKRSLARSDTARARRKQLVGLVTLDPETVVPEGSQIVSAANAGRIHRPPVPMIGHVTSSYMSATLGHSIALSLVEDGRDRLAEEVAVVARGKAVRARITSPRFYDPEGERLHA